MSSDGYILLLLAPLFVWDVIRNRRVHEAYLVLGGDLPARVARSCTGCGTRPAGMRPRSGSWVSERRKLGRNLSSSIIFKGSFGSPFSLGARLGRQRRQAQKEFTQNESLQTLDALVCGSTEGPPLATPPATPESAPHISSRKTRRCVDRPGRCIAAGRAVAGRSLPVEGMTSVRAHERHVGHLQVVAPGTSGPCRKLASDRRPSGGGTAGGRDRVAGRGLDDRRRGTSGARRNTCHIAGARPDRFLGKITFFQTLRRIVERATEAFRQQVRRNDVLARQMALS